MSTVFSQSVSSTLICLESLSADFPTLINKMKTAVLGTKPNEALFSTTRMKMKIKMCSGQSGFLYVTSLNNRYYDLPDSFENIPRFKIPKLTRIEIPKSDLQLLKNNGLQFVDGLRQNTIRNQNTKFKAGTLPLRAYASDNYSHTPINTHSIFSSEDSESTSEDPKVAEDPVQYFMDLSQFWFCMTLVSN